jgi:hypothetical protein
MRTGSPKKRNAPSRPKTMTAQVLLVATVAAALGGRESGPGLQA